MLESVARTGALVTAEEGTLTGGFGAEIAARVQERGLERPPRARAAGRGARRDHPVGAVRSRTRCSRAWRTSSTRSLALEGVRS